MNTAPDPLPLLDDVLDESGADTLTLTLQAVRARRRQRQMVPVAIMLLLPSLVWVGTHFPTTGDPTAPISSFAAAPPVPLPSQWAEFERVHSVALAPTEILLTLPDTFYPGRVRSQPPVGLRASDEELLALAGGRGVGLFRVDGHAELLSAGWDER